jgi:thiol-disulfide isomerase/thioredoxin
VPATARSGRGAWIGVVGVVLALGIGTWALIRFVPSSAGTQLGQRLPDYRLMRLPGRDSIGIRATYAGHVTLVNLWATWCGPCVEEMPSIERLYVEYRDRGFRVAAASIDRGDPGPVLAFAQRLGVTFDVLQDQSGAIQDRYQALGVPASFLIDGHGRIRYMALGATAWDSPENRNRVDQLLRSAD